MFVQAINGSATSLQGVMIAGYKGSLLNDDARYLLDDC